MANIKFSAFTQKVAQADVDFLVGYTGADNVRITPAALGDGIYLPLGGGTMTGTTSHGDSVYSYWGASNDLRIYHNGADSHIDNYTGNLNIVNNADDKDINFYSDDGSGGVEIYFYLDGSSSKTVFPDSKQLQFGSGGGDSFIYSDGSDTYFQANNGNLWFYQGADDSDIKFSCDDGSGGVTEYFRVDGGENRIVYSADSRYLDNVKSMYGSGADLQIYHDATDSIIANSTGILYVRATDNFVITNSAGSENVLIATPNGACKLYYDAANKLETTSTGIKVADEVSIGTSLVHTGDTDTKVSFGTDEIVLTTAGTDAVTVNSSQDSTFAGDVTVGALTVGQTAQLVVNHEGGATTVAKFMSRTNRAQVQISDNDTTGYLVSEGGVFSIGRTASASANNINIDASHNVGIGTTTPASKLSIEDGDLEFLTTSAATIKNKIIFSESVWGDESFYIEHDGSGAGAANILKIYGDGSGGTARGIVIARTGDVGMGTVTPTAALQVVGLVEYADNAAALAAGLTAGAFYRTGDLLKVVH